MKKMNQDELIIIGSYNSQFYFVHVYTVLHTQL